MKLRSPNSNPSPRRRFASVCGGALLCCSLLYLGAFHAADPEGDRSALGRWLSDGVQQVLGFVEAIGGPELEARAGEARVVRLLGKARIKSTAPGSGQGGWRPLRVGQMVQNGDLLETGAGSQLIVQHGSTQIRLGARTQTRVDNLLDRKRQSQLHLQKGFAWFKVNGKQQPRGFRVTTPTAIASVRGTMFSLTETESGALSCTCEGLVDMQSAAGNPRRAKVSPVPAGESYTYSNDGAHKAKDFRPYFRGLKADRSFQSQILKDTRLNSCKSCHQMTNLATDTSPDPAAY